MSAAPVGWSADDPESAAAHVGGRPVHVWWARLRGSFRVVLLEPHRRAGGGTVGWRWRAPTHAPATSAADLAMLRRRLEGARQDFAAELERADTGPADLHAAMQAVVEGLVQASDTQLSAYVVATEQGWMIRSWGFAQPAAAVREGSDANTEESVPPGDSSNAVETAKPVPVRRRRRVTVVAIVASAVLMLIAGWRLQAGRQAPEDVPSENAVEVVSSQRPDVIRLIPDMGRMPMPRSTGILPVSAESNSKESLVSSPVAEKTTAKTMVAPTVVKAGQPMPNRTTAGNAPVPPVINRPVNAAITGASQFADWSVPAVPAAFTGVMPVSAEAKGDRAGPDSTLAGEPEPGIAVARPDGVDVDTDPQMNPARTEGSSQATPRGARAGEEITDAGKNDVKSYAEVNGTPSPARRAPLRTPPPGDEDSRVEARRNSSIETLMAPDSGRQVARPEMFRTDADVDDSDESSAAGKPSPTVMRATHLPDEKTTGLAEGVTAGGGEGLEFPLRASVTAGAWRVVRVRDVMLATWPTEPQGKGDALKAARAQTLAATREEMPVSFRSPVVRQGWRLKLAATAWLSAPPVWRDAKTGEALAERETDRVNGWTEVEVFPGLDARLVAADGREYARVVAGKDGRSTRVNGARAVLAAVPWVGVDVAAGETGAARWAWRSLSAGWPDASRETIRDEHRVRVRCYPEPAGKTGGILALVDDASGWALVSEWSADVGADASAGAATSR